MQRTSLGTAVFRLTEHLFVPEYWNPPSLFESARRTRLDVESVIFSFAIGGVGVVLHNALTRTHLAPVPAAKRSEPLHRLHRMALLVPAVTFVPLAFLPWNSIDAAVVALILGSAASVICRPRLLKKTLTGGALFLGFYAVFMVGLAWFAPGYIAQVWNLPALSGVLVYGISFEELLHLGRIGVAFMSTIPGPKAWRTQRGRWVRDRREAVHAGRHDLEHQEPKKECKAMTSYVGPIETQALKNAYFRQVLFTGKHIQLVVM